VVKQSLGTVGYQQAEPGAGQKWQLYGELGRPEGEVENPSRTTGRVPVSRHIDDQDGWSSVSFTAVDVARDVAMTTGEWRSSQEAIEERRRVIVRRRRGPGAARWRGSGPSADARPPVQVGRR
jgi:hypothetical protein